MSADLMIVCKEDNSHYEGDSDKAFFVDETSMGEPWSDFGKWFVVRYSGAPGILEQIAGMKEHNYREIQEADILAVKQAVKDNSIHEALNVKGLIEYLRSHLGKNISTEGW